MSDIYKYKLHLLLLLYYQYGLRYAYNIMLNSYLLPFLQFVEDVGGGEGTYSIIYYILCSKWITATPIVMPIDNRYLLNEGHRE